MGLWPGSLCLGQKGLERLKASWAESFQRDVWPLLLQSESEFGMLYDQGRGRPNFSIARKLGVMLLREMTGLESDEAALEELQFNLRWRHALAVSRSESRPEKDRRAEAATGAKSLFRSYSRDSTGSARDV